MSVFADRLRAWLMHLGWTRYRLAQEMGGGSYENQIARWLSGKHDPNTRSVRKIAEAMGIGEGAFWVGPPAGGVTAAPASADGAETVGLAEALDEPPPPTSVTAAAARQRSRARRSGRQHPS